MTNNLNSSDPFGIGRGVHMKTNQIMHGSGRMLSLYKSGKIDYRSTLGKPSSKTACKIGFEVSRPSWKIASSTKQMNVKAKSMRLGKLGMCLYISSNNVESSCESIKALQSDVRGESLKDSGANLAQLSDSEPLSSPTRDYSPSGCSYLNSPQPGEWGTDAIIPVSQVGCRVDFVDLRASLREALLSIVCRQIKLDSNRYPV
ncbi:hypothetical protein NEUTE2DRAFT_123838 [Neurospora tetrasperma FGSC 2509]|nr:hypothetical protein NEUTE2DRAFT_123838 [Neurospora tetrasperma FGSC 2509]